ncbi:uncharacterized protein [Spinacia oleracea]|uniref:Uncharacterized protein isoform X1 n=1 Tax=Spinacia oleracea TaxID=3562 RepID=A0A9R0KBH0_SPIOL|nr:uncharacterized protein LOC110804251 isoform X1 [Spinacia oleracea]
MAADGYLDDYPTKTRVSSLEETTINQTFLSKQLQSFEALANKKQFLWTEPYRFGLKAWKERENPVPAPVEQQKSIETFVGGGEAERVDLSRGNVGKKRKGSMSTDDDFRGHGHAVVLVGWEPGNKFVYLNSRSADWGVEANLKDRKPKKRGRERKSIASTCTKLKEASKGFSTVTAEGLHFVYCPQLLKWW